MASRFSEDAFLDEIRRQVDPEADACVSRLFHDGGAAASAALFRHVTGNDDALPEGSPPALAEFFAAARELPPGTDLARIARGEFVWMKNAFAAALVLLAKSLPEGYAAPSFGQILSLSGDLQRHPYRRLLGVLQMVVNVSSPGGFLPKGKAITTAAKMRLLHAGIRGLVLRRMKPAFDTARYGPPVNHEDMLATIMGFSYLVIDGMRILGVGLRPDEEEDLYYLWRSFALLMGIHPPGQPDDASWVPASVAEAAEFYAAFKRRHYVGPDQNPKGVQLAWENLRMLQDMIPRAWRAVGLGVVPRMYMQDLIGPEGCARVKIPPVLGHRLLKGVLLGLVRFSHRVVEDVPGRVDESFARLVFQGMINRSWHGEVTFLIPDTIADIRRLA